MRCYLFDLQGRTIVDNTGHPQLYDYPDGFPLKSSQAVARISDYDLRTLTQPGHHVSRTTDPQALYALAVLQHRESCRFDPLTGQPLDFPDHLHGRTPDNNEVFPRINPAVIGLIQLEDTDQILLARNALRPQYYSLIAGYVGLGETFEETMIREAWEETGRHITNLKYICSQPWPYSGSLMVGFTATTKDELPVGTTDGELVEIRWASKSDIQDKKITLPWAGSLAHRLIQRWIEG